VKCLAGVRSGGGATASYRSLPTPTSRTSSEPTTRPAATRCRAEMLRANRIVVERSGPIKIVSARRVTMPDRDDGELGGGQSVAHACKGTRIP